MSSIIYIGFIALIGTLVMFFIQAFVIDDLAKRVRKLEGKK